MVAGIQANLKPKVVTSKSTSLAMERPNFIQNAKIFGKFLLAPAEESGANPIQKLLPVGLIAFGLPALPALLFKNWVSTPNAKLPDNPFWADIVTKLAYASDFLFQGITFINLAIALLTPSPGRVLTYGLLALANQFIAGPNNKKSLDNGVALRTINEQIEIREDKLKDAKVSSEEKNKIKAELQELYKQEAEINKSNQTVKAWVQFFGNSIFNFILSFSFLAFVPTLSKSCRFTRVDRYNRESPYDKKWDFILYNEHDLKKILFGGAKNYNDEILGSYPQAFLKQAKMELITFKETINEFIEGLKDGSKFQGTLVGRNKRVEQGEGAYSNGKYGLKQLLEKREAELGRPLNTWEKAGCLWANRLSEGLFPAITTSFNTIARMSIFISALTAFFAMGIDSFAPQNSSVANGGNSNLNGLTNQNLIGTTALTVTSGLTNLSRGLSAGTNIISSYNNNILFTAGNISAGFLRGGGLLSGLSAIADKGFNQPGFGLTLQFISSLLLWIASGLGNINKGFSKYHQKEAEKLNLSTI